MYIANRDGNVKEKKGFTCRGIYVWLTMDHVERECTYHVMSPSIHPFGLRETIREKGGERGRKGGKDARDISRKCIRERRRMLIKDWNGETLNCFARENKWHIDVCYGSDFLAQKSRLATISSPTSSSYAYKI